MSGTLLYWNNCGDTYVAADSVLWGFSPAVGTVTTGRFSGSNCYKINNQTIVAGIYGTASAHQTHHFAWKVDNLTNQQDFYLVRESGTNHVTIRLNTNGSLSITRAGTVLGTTSAGVISATVWYHIGLDITIHDTTGAFILYINGVSTLTGSGLDTRNGGTGVCDSFGLFGNGGSNTYFDDHHIWDGADFKGDTRVIGDVANAAGANTTWTPNASTNISRVNQANQDGDTTYNSDSTSGHIDTFGFPALPVGSGATVYAVCPHAIARKDDAGTRNLAIVVYRGGTSYAGSTQALTSTYARWKDQWTQDPSTSADWASVADVNAGEYGYKDV